MKSFGAIALLALAAGVVAVDPKCDANYIVEQCKATQTDRIDACTTQDWDCLCPAYEAFRTCYNNCPNDTDIPSVEGQVTIFCQNASLYGSKATAAPTATAGSSKASTTGAAAATSTDAPKSTSPTEASGNDEGAAADLVGNTGAVLMAVAGVVAAIF
jgi:hypothetical protein